MSDRDALRVTGLVVAAGLALGLLASTVSVAPPGRGPMGTGGGEFLAVKLALSTYNLVIFGVLAATYARLYRRVPTSFTATLLLFTVALLLYAAAASPLVHLVFGFRGAGGLGPFTFLPDAFAAVAGTALVYQTRQ